jgi:hypothetical protein
MWLMIRLVNALIENLRLEGFAVQEATQQSIQQQIFAAPNQPDTEPQKGLALSYIIDQSGDLYHVKLMIDDMRLSRAFACTGRQYPSCRSLGEKRIRG